MTARVFVARALPVDAAETLRGLASVTTFDRARGPTLDEWSALAAEAVAVVPLVTDRVDAAVLGRLPRVRLVANYGAGVDNVDLGACAARGVAVTNTPDVLTEATAEVAMLLLLMVARRVPEATAAFLAGPAGPEFDGWSPTAFLGRELAGATLGIYGWGRIGRAVARRAEAFGMTVLHTSRTSGVSFDELLERADAISIHAPLTPQTHHAFGDAAFARARRAPILVNTARGPIVDEVALVDALDRGQVAGAGLDVFEKEPRVHPSLEARPNVVLLPHIGSATTQARVAMANLALANVRAFLEHRPLLTPVT